MHYILCTIYICSNEFFVENEFCSLYQFVLQTELNEFQLYPVDHSILVCGIDCINIISLLMYQNACIMFFDLVAAQMHCNTCDNRNNNNRRIRDLTPLLTHKFQFVVRMLQERFFPHQGFSPKKDRNKESIRIRYFHRSWIFFVDINCTF